jgi:nucleoid-associated protein YgaU
MNKPIVTFTSIAALAVAALAGTLYWTNEAERPAPVVMEKTMPDVPKAETEVAVATPTVEEPKVEAPKVETPVAVAPAPVVVLPAFDTVRVETTGDAVIAGRAEPDADVTVKWNGNVVGTAKSNADGSFVVVPSKPLTKGTGALTLEMSKNGEVTQSEGSVIVAVKENEPALVAKVNPVAPTEVLQSGEAAAAPKDVQLTAVDYDAAGNIVFSGTSVPGSAVRFYVDNAAVGEGVADAAGKWSFKGTSTVAPGTHTLRADAVDAAGKVISRIELPFLREDAATVAASQVAVAEPEAAPVSRSVTIEKTPEATPVVEPETQVVAAAPIEPVVVDEGPRKLVIQPGNSLWKLSREVYGKGRMFTVIYEANRDQLKNPNKIFPGQILTAPKQN